MTAIWSHYPGVEILPGRWWHRTPAFQAWASRLALPTPSPFKILRRQIGFGRMGEKRETRTMAQVSLRWVGETQGRGYRSRHLQ